MKKYWIEYSDTWKNYPMAYWVHIEKEEKLFCDSEEYDPPAPKKDINGQYKIYNIEFNGYIFIFSSLPQYNVFIETLSQKQLPRTIDLSKKRKGGKGPNSHWLSRLPAKVKSWKFREELIDYLKKIKSNLF